MIVEVCWEGLWTLSFWALTISWSRLLARVWKWPIYNTIWSCLLQSVTRFEGGLSVGLTCGWGGRHIMRCQSQSPHGLSSSAFLASTPAAKRITYGLFNLREHARRLISAYSPYPLPIYLLRDLVDHVTYSPPTLTGVGHQWMVSINIGCN